MAMRVGIFDPTADPPHLGHLMVMEMTRISLGLDRMVITSPGDHVTKRYLTRAEDRLAMLKLLIPERLKAYYEFVDELALEGGYFTHKLTDEAARRYPDATRYYLLGSDNLISFAGWGNHNEIIARTKLAVIPRAGSNLFDLMEEEPGDQHARHPVSPDMSLADAKAWIRAHYFNHRTGEHDIVVVQPAVRMDISSSFIRQALERGDDVSFILTEPVQAYIDTHKLYRRRGRQTKQEGAGV